MRQTVFGIFEKSQEAQNAVNKLLEQGFVRKDIDVKAQSSADAGQDLSKDRNRNQDSGNRIGNFFSNLFGGDTEESRTYTEVARRGTVVTVHTQTKEDADRAASILDDYGAIDAKERARKHRQGGQSTTATRGETGAEEKIPVVEEHMEVGKREVETGGVRLRSRIIERPVEENLRLREEHVEVDRQPVNRAATDEDLKNFTEGETEITEHAERPVVNKEARVVEELRVKKEERERNEKVRGSVRKQDVDVKKTNKDREADRKKR